MVGLITIALSVYMITYSHTLYRWLEPALNLFERKTPYREEQTDSQPAAEKTHDVVLFGLGRYGAAIALHLREENFQILAVDFNPEEIRRLRRGGFDAVYGDASDQDFVSNLDLRGVKWVIAALPHHQVGFTHEDPRTTLIDGLKFLHYEGKIAVTTHHTHEVEPLKAKGADLVLLLFVDAAEQAVDRIKQSISP